MKTINQLKMKKPLSALLLAMTILGGCTTPTVNNNQTQTTQPPQTQNMSEQKKASLADLIKAQPVFADSTKIYTQSKVTPAIKENGTDVTKAKNYQLMQQALDTELTASQKVDLQ